MVFYNNSNNLNSSYDVLVSDLVSRLAYSVMYLTKPRKND